MILRSAWIFKGFLFLATLQELFSPFGSMSHAAVHFDKDGKSLGIADVVFKSRDPALRAMRQYNNVPLDGLYLAIICIHAYNSYTIQVCQCE